MVFKWYRWFKYYMEDVLMTLYAGNKKVCPTVGFINYILNIDGGNSRSKYVYIQFISGGTAQVSGTIKNKIDGGDSNGSNNSN